MRPKCTAADTWTEFYTPIPYPHPLRRQACSALGGICCTAGQECQGGRFDPSSDCSTLCCVGGTCAAAPDPVADGPADGAEEGGLDAASDMDARDGGEQEGGGDGGCGCAMAR